MTNQRATGIEPAWPAWKAGTLPLSYARNAKKAAAPFRLCQVLFGRLRPVRHLTRTTPPFQVLLVKLPGPNRSRIKLKGLVIHPLGLDKAAQQVIGVAKL